MHVWVDRRRMDGCDVMDGWMDGVTDNRKYVIHTLVRHCLAFIIYK